MTRDEIRARIPLLAADHPWDGGIWDPLAGSLRIRRALDALAARATIRRARVDAIDADGRVRIGDEVIDADAVLVCAGLGTRRARQAARARLRAHGRSHTCA